MISDVLRSISGIEVFPIFALLFSIVLFLVLTFRAFRLDRGEVEHIKRLPLEPDMPVCTNREDPDGPREG